MATTRPTRPDHPPTPAAGRTRPDRPSRPREPADGGAGTRTRSARGEGLIAAEGPLVVRTGKHTGRSPQDKFIVDEPSSHGKIWWGEVNRPISEAHYDRLRARLMAYCAEKRPVQPGPAHRRAIRPSAPPARLHGDGLGQHLRAQPVPPARRRGARRLRAELHDHRRPVVPGRPRDRGHPHRDRDPAPPRADGDHHRRHRVRRRDQEVGVHGHELPDARRGRPADALVGQRRAGRRQRRSSSACRGPARPRSRPIPSAASSATTSTAGATRLCSTSRAAATPRRSASRRCTSPTSSRRRGGSGRSSRTSTSTR